MSGWRKRTIMDMAKEAGLRDWTCNGKYGCLEAFADLVRADEREACAKVCEQYGYEHYCGNVTDKLAETIRARGQA